MGVTMAIKPLSRGERPLMIVRPYAAMTADEERYAHWWMVRGCEEAREQLILQCVRIVRMATDRAYLVREQDRDDLECEVLLNLTRAMRLFDPDRGRLSTFALNASIRRAWQIANEMNERFEYQSDDPEAEEWLYVDEQRDDRYDDRLALALTALDEREHDVIRRRYYQSQTLDEIGQAYGLSRQRVAQIMNRAFKKMRERLDA